MNIRTKSIKIQISDLEGIDWSIAANGAADYHKIVFPLTGEQARFDNAKTIAMVNGEKGIHMH
jgi:hypothetical protein